MTQTLTIVDDIVSFGRNKLFIWDDTSKFRPWDDNEKLFGSEVSYLSAIGALMNLANNTSPDIKFVSKFIS